MRSPRHEILFVLQVEEAGVHIQDPELRKILSLTTADLRFADYLVKHVTENRDDVFLDGTGWEGGDEWIRAQFTLYLHSLLSSALQQGETTQTPSADALFLLILSSCRSHFFIKGLFYLIGWFNPEYLQAMNTSLNTFDLD